MLKFMRNNAYSYWTIIHYLIKILINVGCFIIPFFTGFSFLLWIMSGFLTPMIIFIISSFISIFSWAAKEYIDS